MINFDAMRAGIPHDDGLRDYLIDMSSQLAELALVAQKPKASALFALASAEMKKTTDD